MSARGPVSECPFIAKGRSLGEPGDALLPQLSLQALASLARDWKAPGDVTEAQGPTPGLGYRLRTFALDLLHLASALEAIVTQHRIALTGSSIEDADVEWLRAVTDVRLLKENCLLCEHGPDREHVAQMLAYTADATRRVLAFRLYAEAECPFLQTRVKGLTVEGGSTTALRPLADLVTSLQLGVPLYPSVTDSLVLRSVLTRARPPAASVALSVLEADRARQAQVANELFGAPVFDVEMPLVLAAVLRECHTPGDILTVTRQIRQGTGAKAFRKWACALDAATSPRQTAALMADAQTLASGLGKAFPGVPKVQLTVGILTVDPSEWRPPGWLEWVLDRIARKSHRIFLRSLAREAEQVGSLETQITRVFGIPKSEATWHSLLLRQAYGQRYAAWQSSPALGATPASCQGDCAGLVIADTGTRLFHTPTCPTDLPSDVGRMAFFRTADEARREGFRPCDTCQASDAGALTS